MPRKKKEVNDGIEENLTPDETDLEDDTLSMTEDEDLSLTDDDTEEEYELASEADLEGMDEEVVSGIELQLGVLTARIEELTTIVRKLEKKLEKAAIGDSPAPVKRDGGFGREGGFKPREGGFRSDSRGGGDSRGGFAPREGGFRPRDGGSAPREGGFRPRDDSRPPREGSDSRPPREGGFGRGFGGSSAPREGGFRPRDDSRGSSSPSGFGGKRRDHGFSKRRED